MSCHAVLLDKKKHAKVMQVVNDREEYLRLRGTQEQVRNVKEARSGVKEAKMRLVQMNYSCLPNTAKGSEGKLKGSKRASNSVGMDVDLRREDYKDEATYQNALKETAKRVIEMRDELGLLMLERSATKGYHVVFRRKVELNQEENLRWASELLGVEYDPGAKDITRVFFTTTSSEEDLLYLNDDLFENEAVEEAEEASVEATEEAEASNEQEKVAGKAEEEKVELNYLGIPYQRIIDKWWQMHYDGRTPVKSNRDALTYELALNLRHICGFDRKTLDLIIPCYDGFSQAQKLKCIDSALTATRTQIPKRLRDVLGELKKELLKESDEGSSNEEIINALEDAENESELYYYKRLPKPALAQGIGDSIQATGAKMAMPVLAVCCPAIGALATGVGVEIHGKETKLNMHSFVVGDAASGKGDLDNIVEAWMWEESAKNKMYYEQEEEYRARKKAAKNAKMQPEEPHLPVRFLTMNNTVANLSERLANTEGKHAFSFTPEADTVAQKWRSTMSDFSTMLRQSYDGSRYEREAKSADATTVHIEHLLWNVCMCGTPDALYRVINNYTDGLLSRMIIAHTPDNTFAPLEEKPNLLTEDLRERIKQVAHLLPLMSGTLVLSKLEARSREWVEKVRRDTLKNDDRVMARSRLRNHVTAMRMTTCLILCAVAEKLIQEHGLHGAEKRLKQHPGLTKEMAEKQQTAGMLEAYEVIADSLIDNDMLYFREKLEIANQSSEASNDRKRGGKNDLIYDRLGDTFSFEQAMGAKGGGCTRNNVRQMLKNWRNQGLIKEIDVQRYAKLKV